MDKNIMDIEEVKVNNDNVMSTNKLNKDLVVDDSDPNRMVIRKYLQRYGRECHEACNGEEAITMVKKNGTYGIIFLDLSMPKMNGIKCCEFLRKELGYNGTILSLSGHCDEDSINDCMNAGMQGIVKKPIDKKELEAYIDKYGK